MRPSVLFVCVHNAGRSQMAAGILARMAGDRVTVRSATWLGGRIAVNPSGGLLARGHPIGATGGRGLAHNVGGWIGLDVACIHVLRR